MSDKPEKLEIATSQRGLTLVAIFRGLGFRVDHMAHPRAPRMREQ